MYKATLKQNTPSTKRSSNRVPAMPNQTNILQRTFIWHLLSLTLAFPSVKIQ